MLLSEYAPKCKLNLTEHTVETPAHPVIDAHGHFAGAYCPLYAGGTWERTDLAKTVEALRARGICRAVNLDGFWDGFFGLPQEEILRVFEPFDDFFLHFVSVNTARADEPGFARDVRTHFIKAKKLGVRGIKLFKHVSIMRETAPGVYAPGRGIRIDDPRLNVIWETAAELELPVLIHIADPEAFFDPVDKYNERCRELLQHPDWAYHGSGAYAFAELMEAQERLLSANPRTIFIVAHVGSNAENLAFVSHCLEAYPNMLIDIAARIDELGRQPYSARDFLVKWADRVLFGTDVYPETAAWLHPMYYRVLETRDEWIPGGAWPMYGLSLPEDVLRKIYHDNAARLFGLPPLDGR